MKRLLLSGAMLGALVAFVGSAQAADKKTLVFVVNGASEGRALRVSPDSSIG